jgi:hypothetical protein
LQTLKEMAMAKADKELATPGVGGLATAVEPAALALGDVVNVVCPFETVLRNTETGVPFEPGVPTRQLVTLTLLRRLADGDLVLA